VRRHLKQFAFMAMTVVFATSGCGFEGQARAGTPTAADSGLDCVRNALSQSDTPYPGWRSGGDAGNDKERGNAFDQFAKALGACRRQHGLSDAKEKALTTYSMAHFQAENRLAALNNRGFPFSLRQFDAAIDQLLPDQRKKLSEFEIQGPAMRSALEHLYAQGVAIDSVKEDKDMENYILLICETATYVDARKMFLSL